MNIIIAGGILLVFMAVIVAGVNYFWKKKS